MNANHVIVDALAGALVAGKYRVLRQLGRGLVGTVYLCRREPDGAFIALKAVHPELAATPGMSTRFMRETQTVARLIHPNIVRFLESGEDVERAGFYLATEYVEGRTLARVVHEDWPLSDQRIVDIMSQLLTALAGAHALGIVHRDLQPNNILVRRIVDRHGEAEQVLVCDFGIAQLAPFQLVGSPRESLTRLHQVSLDGMVGTPEYGSPEHARGEPLDSRSDLYSAGVVLFQLLTQTVPFLAESSLQVAMKHCGSPPPPPSGFGPVNHTLQEVCLKALSKTREARFQSARDMQNALEAALVQEVAPRSRWSRLSAAPARDPQAAGNAGRTSVELRRRKATDPAKADAPPLPAASQRSAERQPAFASPASIGPDRVLATPTSIQADTVLATPTSIQSVMVLAPPTNVQTQPQTVLATPTSIQPAIVLAPTNVHAETVLATPANIQSVMVLAPPTNVHADTVLATPANIQSVMVLASPTSVQAETVLATPASIQSVTALAPPPTSVLPVTALAPPDEVEVEPEPVLAPPDNLEPQTVLAPPDNFEPQTVIAPPDNLEPQTVFAPPDNLEAELMLAPSPSVEPQTLLASHSSVEPDGAAGITLGTHPVHVPALVSSEPMLAPPDLVEPEPVLVSSEPMLAPPDPVELEPVPVRSRTIRVDPEVDERAWQDDVLRASERLLEPRPMADQPSHPSSIAPRELIVSEIIPKRRAELALLASAAIVLLAWGIAAQFTGSAPSAFSTRDSVAAAPLPPARRTVSSEKLILPPADSTPSAATRVRLKPQPKAPVAPDSRRPRSNEPTPADLARQTIAAVRRHNFIDETHAASAPPIATYDTAQALPSAPGTIPEAPSPVQARAADGRFGMHIMPLNDAPAPEPAIATNPPPVAEPPQPAEPEPEPEPEAIQPPSAADSQQPAMPDQAAAAEPPQPAAPEPEPVQQPLAAAPQRPGTRDHWPSAIRGSVSIESTFTRAAVPSSSLRQAVSRTGILECYRASLGDGGPHRPTIARLDFETSPRGRITFAMLHGARLPKPLRNCIEEVAREGRLPNPPAGNVEASITFAFDPK